MARRTNTTEEFYFDGFESPNTTPVPDVVFDRLLSRLGEAELKALLYIVRRTFGFKKDRDPISFNQFLKGIRTMDGRILDEGCGVRDRTTLSKALKSLETKGIVVSHKGVDERGENATTVYELRFLNRAAAIPTGVVGDSYHPAERVVGNAHHRGMDDTPPVVRNSYQQQTALQETDLDLSNIRMDSHHYEKTGTKETRVEEQNTPTVSESRERTSVARRPKGELKPLHEVLAERVVNGRSGETEQPEQVQVKKAAEPSAKPSARRVITPVEKAAMKRMQLDEDYQTIQTYMVDFARELNDRAPLKSTTTRAYNLMKRSGLAIGEFVAQLYAARAIVKEQSSKIRSKAEHDPKNPWVGGTAHKAPYYFAVLEDLLGLRDRDNSRPSLSGDNG